MSKFTHKSAFSQKDSSLLLRSHQASQQTNFGRVRDLPGLPAPEASFTLDIWMYVSLYVCRYVCISPHLPRFQVVEISEERGIDVEEKLPFRAESHVFAVKSLKASDGCTNSQNI